MPTVPTEQNRVGIAGVTDAKLQPGDYSGTGLQALGAGMQQLGGTGAKIAGEMQERQDRDDDLEVKKAWNAYAEGARGIRADALGKFDTDPQGMLDSMTRDYGGLRDWIRSGLKNDRQRGRFDHVIAERFDYDISGALGSAGQAMRRGQNQQSVLLEQNAADDAVDNSDNPALFDKHLQTGADSLAARAAARGDDPATIERSITAYGSGIRRRVVESLIDRDPIAAANRYRLMRDQMTPADRQASEGDLLEPLARTVAAQEVDKLLLPEERDSTLSPERHATIAQGIEALPLTEALKRYALDDLDDRGSLETRARKGAADAARETSLATAEQLGPGFISITQIPAAVRRDLDEETDQALRSMARANLDPTPVAPGGEASLMMNIMASENPAAFVKEDLRLVRGKVAPEEYDRLVRLQEGSNSSSTSPDTATRPRMFSTIVGQTLRSDQRSTVSLRPAAYTPSESLPDDGMQAVVAPMSAIGDVVAEKTGRPLPPKDNVDSGIASPKNNALSSVVIPDINPDNNHSKTAKSTRTKTPPDIARIYIGVSDGGGGSSAAIDMGHAWVEVIDTMGGRTTYGLWSDGYSQRNGDGKDIRANYRSDIGRASSEVRFADIPEGRRAAVNAILSKNEKYSEYSNNCVHFVIRVWEAATGRKITLPAVMPPTPHWLIQKMRAKN